MFGCMVVEIDVVVGIGSVEIDVVVGIGSVEIDVVVGIGSVEIDVVVGIEVVLRVVVVVVVSGPGLNIILPHIIINKIIPSIIAMSLQFILFITVLDKFFSCS